MIAFLDKDVYSIEKNLISIEDVMTYFSQKEHVKDILLLYDEGKYYGMICYQSFINYMHDFDKEAREEGYIIKEVYVHKTDDTVLWNNLRMIFSNTHVAYIPIFRNEEKSDLVYFAYEIEGRMDAFRRGLENVRECENRRFFEHIDTETEAVRIYDLNELGFLFWEIATQKYHIPVEVIGEKWDVLFPNSKNGKTIHQIPQNKILEYYPQSNPQFLRGGGER